MSTEEQHNFDALEVLTFINAVDFSNRQPVICLFSCVQSCDVEETL